MKTLDIPRGSVVVGVDGSHHSDHAVDWAARHAAKESRDLVLLHAVDDTWAAVAWTGQGGVGIDAAHFLKQADVAGQAILDAAAARAGSVLEPGTFRTLITHSDPRTALLKASETASVVVVGSRGRGPLATLLLGSVSAAVARHTSCPIVVIRPHHPGLVRRGVLVGADGSAGSPAVLEFAYRQAAELDLPLTVMHTVWDALAVASETHPIPQNASEYDAAALPLAEAVAGLSEKFPEVNVHRTIVRGAPNRGLLEIADSMDLVVVGHQRHDPVSRALFGSVAMSVLEHAATAVAVVPET